MTRPKQDRIPILERTDARGRLLYRRTGGGNTPDNLRSLCRPCHVHRRRKG